MNNKNLMYKGFSWVIDNKLSGMPCPGIFGSEKDNIGFLQKEGITLLVSLTLKTPDLSILKAAKIGSFHLPVKDFHAPTIKQLYDFSHKTAEEILKGGKVGVHCYAGKGRTGTFLSAYLVFKGRRAETAIAEIRELRPGSIETEEQKEIVEEFYKYLKKKQQNPLKLINKKRNCQ